MTAASHAKPLTALGLEAKYEGVKDSHPVGSSAFPGVSIQSLEIQCSLRYILQNIDETKTRLG